MCKICPGKKGYNLFIKGSSKKNSKKKSKSTGSSTCSKDFGVSPMLDAHRLPQHPRKQESSYRIHFHTLNTYTRIIFISCDTSIS